jgi:hypothetical protein
MIGRDAPAEKVVTTSEAHVRSVARRQGTEPIPAGPYLYCVRRTPLLSQPLVYRARVTR